VPPLGEIPHPDTNAPVGDLADEARPRCATRPALASADDGGVGAREAGSFVDEARIEAAEHAVRVQDVSLRLNPSVHDRGGRGAGGGYEYCGEDCYQNEGESRGAVQVRGAHRDDSSAGCAST
jgi:hypothetical protein